jgi:hypothetical protein
MSAADPHLKAEAIRLRVEERRSLREIEALTKAARSSLSLWLRPYPLTEEERKARSRAAKRYVTPKKSHGEESKHHRAVVVVNLPTQQKGKIAEAAVLFRLLLHGFIAYKSPFDGDKTDFMVEVPETGERLKLQVRWMATPTRHGLPGILLTCADGHHKRRRYRPGEFDFIVGYYLFNDTAYVFSFDEVTHLKTHATVSEEHAERWDKLKRSSVDTVGVEAERN